MVSAKSQRKVERKAKFGPEIERRQKQAALKERILREQALRRAREMAGLPPERPLAELAKTEAELKAKQEAAQAPQAAAPGAAAGPSKAGAAARAVGKGLLEGFNLGWKGIKAGATAYGKEEQPRGEPNKLAGWIFFALSILLYYFIDLGTGYNGIDVGFFIGLSGIDWLLKSGFFTILLIVFVAQFFFERPSSPEELKSNIFLDVVLTFVFVVVKYSPGALYHTIFLLGMYFFLIKPVSDRVTANRTLTILILLDFLGFSLLELLLSKTGFLAGSGIVASYMIFPIFSLYILGYLKVYGRSGLASFLLFFIILLYIFGLVRTLPQYATLAAELETRQREEAWGFWKTSLIRFREFGGMFFDPLLCSSAMADVGGYEECLRQREYARLCADKRGTDEYEQCLKQKQGLGVTGTADTSIKEFTKIEFKRPAEFPRQIQKEFAPPMPMQLNIESPKKPITIELSCRFKTAEEDFEGDIQPKKIEGLTGKKQQIILCALPSGKEYKEERTYTVVYTAKIEGIETESTLTRLFVGKELKENEKISLLSLHGLSQTEASKNPMEFAVFSFGIGTPPTNPFIDDSPVQPIIGNIENIADGEIIAVEGIEVSLVDGLTPTEHCMAAFTQQGDRLVLKPEVRETLKNLSIKKGEKRFLLGCYLNIASSLAETKEYVKRGFSSKIIYSYKIQKEERFVVAKSFSIV